MSARRRRASLALALLLGSQAPRASATSASLSGMGPRAQALAGAGATLDLGYEATFHNPASLSFAPKPALSIGYAVTDTSLFLRRGPEPERRFRTDQLRATLLGFTLPLWLGEQPLVLGLASVSPGGFVARADLPLGEEPQFPLLVSRRQALDFDLALGMRPWRFLALGVGLRALSTLAGTAAVQREGSRTTTRVDDALEPVLAPHAGASIFLAETATLALTWRAPLRADFDVRLGAVDLGATQLPPLNLTGVAHYDPLSVQAEYSHRFGAVRALVGAAYLRYRDAPALLPATVECPAERPDCLALTAPPVEFHDTFDLHAAVAFELVLTRPATAELRAGYAYLPSPLPEQQGSENLLDSARHRLALGYGVALSEPLPDLGLDFALQIDNLVSRTHRKASDVADDNAGAPELTTRGHIITASLGLTLRLQ